MNTTTVVRVKQITLKKPSHVATAAESEHKLDVLRKLYKQTTLDVRLSATRKAMVLQSYADKAAWHKGNIAAWNRVALNGAMEYGVAI